MRFLLALALLVGLSVYADEAADAGPFVEAVSSFMEALPNDELRDVVSFDLDGEEREAWHFIPKDRIGLHLRDLDEAGQARFMALVKSLFSEEGFATVEQIRNLESVLKVIEGEGAAFDRNPLLYTVAVFGAADVQKPWGLRYEGHHLSFNWTFAGGKVISSSPEFMGSNPAVVLSGPQKGLHTLGERKKMGLALLESFDEKQRGVAVIGEKAPSDIVTSSDRVAAIEGNYGLKFGEMTELQQRFVMELLTAFASTQREDVAKARLGAVQAEGMQNLTFAWMGDTTGAKGHYYRIQGPSFVAEYDNVQNGANHIHTVWRDFDGDFGRDVLKEHHAHGHDHGHSHAD